MNYELDSEPNTWHPRSRSSSKPEVATRRKRIPPRRSTTVAVVVLGLAILSCLLGYCVLSESAPYDSKSLRLLFIIFRHGARTPSHFCNTDPYKNYNWPNGLGSLTNAGKLQLYELGRKLRVYYTGFVSEEYQDRDVYVLSSDQSRCLMSASTLLAGLYPPGPSQVWHPDIPWQPVPVHTLPRYIDMLIAGKKPCEKYEEHLARAYSEESSKPEHAEVFTHISKHCNQTTNILDVELMCNTFNIEREFGLKLPDWTKNVYPDKMEEMAGVSLSLLTLNTTMTRLRAGPLMADILKKMQQKAAGKLSPDRSIFLFSSHDVTVVGARRALGLSELIRPDYGSALVLELHREEGEERHYVKAFYWNNTKMDAPTELSLPLCSDPCSLADFTSSLKPHIPVNWDAECAK